MDINLEVCRTIAVQHGLPLQYVIKEFQLFDVLSQITAYCVSEKKQLVFKGGTALNKVYINKGQRFSEDIDFDFEVEDSQPFARELAGKIKGYKITTFRKVRKTTMFCCAYESPFGQDHIRVDISGKRIVTAKPLQRKSAVSEITHGSVSGFEVYGLEDLVARKMHALCTRTEGKDVYDVHSSLSMCKDMGEAITAMLKSEGKEVTPAEFMGLTIKAVKNADHKKLRNFTNPFIPIVYRPGDWLELKNDLILKLENLRL